MAKWLAKLVQKYRQWYCDHGVYIEEIKRISEDKVTAKCFKCGKKLSAHCGLTLTATLEHKPTQPKK